MAWINGTYVDDRPLAHAQPVFVAQDSLERVRRYGRDHAVDSSRIEHLLTEACDPDNYARDRWHTRLGDAVFEFHLARLRVELRSIKTNR